MPPNSLDPTLSFLVALAQIVGALGTAAAFFVTYLTLLELKRQTDLANNPALRIRFRSLPKTTEDALPLPGGAIEKRFLQEGPHQNWLTIITRNLDQDISGLQDTFLALECSNAGKSEITTMSFQVSLIVSMFENETLGYKIEPLSYTYSIEFTPDLSEKAKVYVLLTNGRYFPSYTLSINNVSYQDVRGKEFREFDGPPRTEVSNEILRPIAQPPGRPEHQAKVTQIDPMEADDDPDDFDPPPPEEEIPF